MRKRLCRGLQVLLLGLIVIGLSMGTKTMAAKQKKVYRVNKYGALTEYVGSEQVTIRKNVSAIDETVFNYSSTTSFVVEEGNANFKSIDGVLYSKDGTLLVRCPTKKTGKLVIPSSVKRIAKNAFYRCKKLTAVSIPASIKQIDNECFEGCKKLVSVTLPNGLRTIGRNAFRNCYELTNINLPASLKRIGESAFRHCESLASIRIPNGTTRLSYGLFEECKSLRNVTLPSSLTYIGGDVFGGCDSLKSIHIPEKVEEIGSGAFYGCSSLEKCFIPNRVEKIGSNLFSYCESLKEVELSPNITAIPRGCFQECKNLSGVKIPDGVLSIGDEAFDNCVKIDTLNIPASVKKLSRRSLVRVASEFRVEDKNRTYQSIGGVVFTINKEKLIQYPAKKNGVYVIPDGVKRIGEDAFYQCEKLTKLTIPEGVEELHLSSIQYDSALKELHLPLSLKSITTDYIEPELYSLEKITIPEQNENYACLDGSLYNRQLTSLVLFTHGKKGTIHFPDSLQSIGHLDRMNHASKFVIVESNEKFSSKDGVLYNKAGKKIRWFPYAKKEYIIPKETENISFLMNQKQYLALKNIRVEAKNRQYKASQGMLFTKNQRTLLYVPPKRRTSVTIPSYVSTINSRALEYVSGLRKLVIPANVRRFTSSLRLYGCDRLHTIEVKEGDLKNLYVSISDENRLKKVVVPSSVSKLYIQTVRWNYTIYGWTNTVAENYAKDLKVPFVSAGVVPKKVNGLKLRSIVDHFVLTWNRNEEADGYEVYTDDDTIGVIKNGATTTCSFDYDKLGYYSRVYVRAFRKENGKTKYGKAGALRYRP